MKLLVKAGLFILSVVMALGCNGDYRHKAIGGMDEAVVIMDSTAWNSQTADAIQNSFGAGIETLPNIEALFDLRFKDFSNNAELEQLKKYKNVIIAASINDSSNVAKFIRALLEDQVEQRVKEGRSFAFPLNNQWYRDQWTMILTSTSDSVLAEKIRSSQKTLVQNLLDKTFKRETEQIYKNAEQAGIEDSLWANHGWKIRVQHDWIKRIDTSYAAGGDTNHIVTMRRPLPQNDRWFWAWWKDDVRNIDFLDNNWINTKRDSLMKQWIRGTRDSSYVTTEYRRPVKTESFRLKGNLSYETLGTWRMTHDAMGGPFVNLTVYDQNTNRLFIVEFGQFAPKYHKRRFVRQFRTMLRSFESDSIWNKKDKSQNKVASK